MSGPVLKPCPFCGDAMELWDFDTHARHIDSDRKCPLASHAIGIEAWNRRTPDPAQIRADAIREIAIKVKNYGEGSGRAECKRDCNALHTSILALLATPLSPTAVDSSPAPDSGSKEDK